MRTMLSCVHVLGLAVSNLHQGKYEEAEQALIQAMQNVRRRDDNRPCSTKRDMVVKAVDGFPLRGSKPAQKMIRSSPLHLANDGC